MTLRLSLFKCRFWILLVGLVTFAGVRPSIARAQEDCIGFDPARAAVQYAGGRWKIVVGNMWLLDFGSSRAEAEQALRIIRHYGMNSQCFVGRPGPSMEYYLVDGQPPRGPIAGEDAIPFDPSRLAVRRVGGRWKIVEGSHLLLDFGGSLPEAQTSLSLIRKYGFNRICFVGRPDPSMVYFRTDCSGLDFAGLTLGSHRLVINGDSVPYTARFHDDCGDSVEAVLQAWIEQGKTYRAAGGVRIKCAAGGTCSQRFTLAANDDTSAGSGQLSAGPAVAVFEILVGGRLVAERRVAVELVEPAPQEDCVSFDPGRLAVELVGGRWTLVDGSHLLMSFGDNLSEASRALRIIRHYGMNSLCFVGRPDPSLEYFLVDGEAPHGRMDGEDAIPFNPERLEVKLVSGSWKIVEGNHWMLDFDRNEAEARRSLEIIQEYGFNRICFVGRPDASMTYFRIDDGGEDPTVPQFVRGDFDSSGALDLADGMALAAYLFLGNQRPSCAKALDSNDSGGIDVADMIHILNYLFSGGPPPAAPFPRCGVDPTKDRLPCQQAKSCR